MDPQTIEKAIKRCIDISTRLGALEDEVSPAAGPQAASPAEPHPDIGALDPAGARRALVKPAAQANVEFDDEAVAAVIRETQG